MCVLKMSALLAFCIEEFFFIFFLKKNLFLFDHFVNTIHTYTLSMSYIYNLNNTNMKILANMVIMRINNNKSRVRRLL